MSFHFLPFCFRFGDPGRSWHVMIWFDLVQCWSEACCPGCRRYWSEMSLEIATCSMQRLDRQFLAFAHFTVLTNSLPGLVTEGFPGNFRSSFTFLNSICTLNLVTFFMQLPTAELAFPSLDAWDEHQLSPERSFTMSRHLEILVKAKWQKFAICHLSSVSLVSDGIRHILALRPDPHMVHCCTPSAEKATELFWLHIWEIWISCGCPLPMLGYSWEHEPKMFQILEVFGSSAWLVA